MSPDKPHHSDLEADAETRQVGSPEPEHDGAVGKGADVSGATRPPDGDKPSQDGGKPQQGALAVVRETAVLVVLAILLAVLFKTFLVQAFYIPSGSMEPTLNISDRVLVEKVSYRFGEVKDGDVIVFVHDLPGAEPESSNPVTRFFTSLGQAGERALPGARHDHRELHADHRAGWQALRDGGQSQQLRGLAYLRTDRPIDPGGPCLRPHLAAQPHGLAAA